MLTKSMYESPPKRPNLLVFWHSYELIVWFFASLLTIYLHLSHVQLAEDDAFIHLRVANNLWEHGVPYFNLSDAVMASTAPLWVLILALITAIAKPGLGQVVLLALFNSLVLLVCASEAVRLTKTLQLRSSVAFKLLVSCTTWSALIASSVSLMETPTAILFSLAATRLCLNGKKSWVIWSTLALFIRPEAIIYIIALTTFTAFQRPSNLNTALPLMLVTATPLVAVQLWYFGTVVPHTAVVKRVVYQLTVNQSLQSFFSGAFGENLVRSLLPVCALSIVAAIIKSIWSRTNNSKSLLLLLSCAMPGLVILLAYVINRALIFPWYAPLISLPILIGTFRLVSLRHHRLLCISILTPFIALGLLYLGSTFRNQLSPQFPSGIRSKILGEIGTALKDCAPSSSIMAPEVGHLGYTFGGEIIDAIGLVSPRALLFHPLAIPTERATGVLGAVPRRLVESEKPDFIVGLPTLLSDFKASSEASKYTEFQVPLQSPTGTYHEVWGNKYISVFRRNGVELCQDKFLLP